MSDNPSRWSLGPERPHWSDTNTINDLSQLAPGQIVDVHYGAGAYMFSYLIMPGPARDGYVNVRRLGRLDRKSREQQAVAEPEELSLVLMGIAPYQDSETDDILWNQTNYTTPSARVKV
jgi:hypothetical protein